MAGKPPVPPPGELRHLAEITRIYLASLADAHAVIRGAMAENADLADRYCELNDVLTDAQRPDEPGTPAAIGRVLGVLGAT